MGRQVHPTASADHCTGSLTGGSLVSDSVAGDSVAGDSVAGDSVADWLAPPWAAAEPAPAPCGADWAPGGVGSSDRRARVGLVSSHRRSSSEIRSMPIRPAL